MTDQPTTHDYLSTGCLHGEHGYCQDKTGMVGAKIPSSCKFCAAPCRCNCHASEPTPDNTAADQAGLRQYVAEALAREAGSLAFRRPGTEWDHARNAWYTHADTALSAARRWGSADDAVTED